MHSKILLVLYQALLLTQVSALKCFHNSVPFLTRELACATMGDNYSQVCNDDTSPPLLFIPNYLAILVANANTSVAPILLKSANSILQNYSKLVMQQENKYLQASIVANQSCADAYIANPTKEANLDSIGAQKKLVQAQNNYLAANESYWFAATGSATSNLKKRATVSSKCAGVVVASYFTSSSDYDGCRSASYFNCLSKTHKNCVPGLTSAAIKEANFINPVNADASADNNSGSCSSSGIDSLCKAKGYLFHGL